MRIHLKTWLLIFSILTIGIAVLVWVYLNIQASMHVRAQNASIQLSESLPTKISVGNYLQAHAKGSLDTDIRVNQNLHLPVKGRYLANLQFTVEVPVVVNVDYKTIIQIDELMPLEANTDLIYQKKLLPKFPLKMDVPIKLDVPFHLKQQYKIPIKILFDGPVYLALDDTVNLNIKHQFKPKLNLNDPITMQKIANFDATLRNIERQTRADLEMQMNMPLKNIHP